MNGVNFSEDDKNKAVAFLNFVYKNAKWSFTSEESFEYGKHVMNFNALIKKIDEHILEIIRVTNAPKEADVPKPPKAK